MIYGKVTFYGLISSLNDLGKERNEMRFKLTTGNVTNKYVARIIAHGRYNPSICAYKIFHIVNLFKDESEIYIGQTGFIKNFGEYETIRDLTIALLCTHKTSHFIYKH